MGCVLLHRVSRIEPVAAVARPQALPEQLVRGRGKAQCGKGTIQIGTLPPIQACALPDHALLAKYRRSGAYTDCYAARIGRPVSQAEFVEAFYTGAVFKLERRLLAWFIARPSTDAQARGLSRGELGDFAAWRVEARNDDQLLMCDLGGRTRSWLMTAPAAAGGTCLYFGSAVVPKVDKASGQARMGVVFGTLLGFHKLYSRVLLHEARARLARRR